MDRNPTLKSRMEEATKESISLLSDYFETYIPKYNGSAYEHAFKHLHLSDSNLLISEHLFLNLILEKRELIENLKSYKEYLFTVTSDSIVSNIMGGRSEFGVLLYFVLLLIISDKFYYLY